MFQFQWIQNRFVKTLYAQILYIQKPLGDAHDFPNITSILNKLRNEHSDEHHTRVQMLVSLWNVSHIDRTFTFDKTCWVDDAAESTSPHWQWKPVSIFGVANGFDYDIKCDSVATPKPMLWNVAMGKIQQSINTNTIKTFHFHPKQEFDNRCYHLAKNCNTMVFLLHLDGISMYHLITLDKEYLTIGFVLLNLVENAKKSKYYFRVSIVPKNESWTYDVIFKLIQKEIDSWKKGFPLQDPEDPTKFTMIYPVFLGILADGKEICKMLHKLELSSYAGALFLKECIRLNPNVIGTQTSPCFISRRFLTNSVC